MGLSLVLFEEFARRKKYFISLLRKNQYRGIEDFEIIKEFKPLKTEKKNDGTGGIGYNDKNILSQGWICEDKENKS